jgi:hypothetical protein
MGGRRKRTLTVSDIKRTESDARCWFCGETRNVPATQYNGLCMSCWWDFHEDDITLKLFKMGEMA